MNAQRNSLWLPVLATLLVASAALAQGYVCAEGGGNPGKGAWAEEVFGWMVEKGGGKNAAAVIIGAVPLEEPDNRIDLFKKLGAKSCVGMVIDEKNADAQETYDQLAAASIIFIRGGAQERYVNWWKGTKTEEAIHAVFDKGGVIAGTSAGCAILGEVSYDSKNGSLKPMEALQDACHKHLTLTTDFLGLVPGVLFDTHFTERGRIARLPVMLAHVRDVLHRDDVIGLGVDPRTAVCVEPGGKATIRGEGTVTLIEFTMRTRSLIFEGQPPLIVGAVCSVLPAGTELDMRTHQVKSALSFAFRNEDDTGAFENMSVDGIGSEKRTPPPADEDKAPKPPPVQASLAWWPRPGLQPNLLSYSVNTWSHTAASIAQQVRRLALLPGPLAVWLGEGNGIAVTEGRTMTVTGSDAGAAISVVALDTRTVRETTAEWHNGLKFALTERQISPIAAGEAAVKFQHDHPIEFAGLTPDQAEAKRSELSEQYRASAFKVRWWLDEDATIKQLEKDGVKGQPAICGARLHILPPGASLDLITGQVALFKYATKDLKLPPRVP